METRANYLLVGSFVLLFAAGLMGFVLWLAKFQFDTEYSHYDIRFTGSVTGLGVGGPVRYSGVRVGEVTDIRLDREDPGHVMVTVELEAVTPVRGDTEASLEIEGLTGTRYVLLSGGTAEGGPLEPTPGEKRAVIPAVTSSLQQVLEGAPELLSSANLLLARATALLSEENQASLSAMLANLEEITGAIADESEGIGNLIDQTGQTMTSLSQASASLETLLVQVRQDSRTLTESAQQAVVAIESMAVSIDGSVTDTTGEVQALVTDLRGSAAAFTTMAGEIQALVAENRDPLRDFTSSGLYELNTLLIEANALLGGLNRVTTEVERDPARFLFGDQQTGYEAGQP
jgi:phospholipid/cholesterol/gamma-HCH transport system substrate-binding protein